MKQIGLLSLATLAMLASCSSDETTNPNGEFEGQISLVTQPFTYEDGTRTTLKDTNSTIESFWKNEDALGVFSIAPNIEYQGKKIVDTKVEDANTILNGKSWSLLKGNTYAAYYPYQELTQDMTYTSVPVIMDNQKQTGNANLCHISSYDYMYAKAEIPLNGNAACFNFNHIGAIATLQLIMPEDVSWKSATLTSESNIFVTSASMDISNGTLTNKETTNSQTLDLVDISGKELTLYMALLPCSTGNLTLTVLSNENKAYTAKLAGKTIEAGKAYKWIASPTKPLFVRSGTENGYGFVDLGLSVKWANMNVGATAVNEYGNYYAWGEVSPQSDNSYSFNTYKWNSDGYLTSMTKYTCKDDNKKGIWYNGNTFVGDGKTVLDSEDDVAIVNWGGRWRMPTQSEQEELIKSCYWIWTNNYNETGVAGFIAYKAKSIEDKWKFNSASSNSYTLSDVHIFLPASGGRQNGSLHSEGDCGCYWSSSLNESNSSSAWYIYFYLDNARTYSLDARIDGFSVRAVCQ